MQKDRRSGTGPGVGPVPVGQQHDIIKPIGATQAFVGMVMRGADHVVIFWVGGIVGPKITGMDRHRPVWQHGPRDPVGAIEQADQTVPTCGRRPVAFAFAFGDAAAPDGARKSPSQKPRALRGDDQITPFQRMCPDFAAFVARYAALCSVRPT